MQASGLQEPAGGKGDHVWEEPLPLHHRTRHQRCQTVRAFLVDSRGKGPGWPGDGLGTEGRSRGGETGGRRGTQAAPIPAEDPERRGSVEGGIPRAFSVAPRPGASWTSRWGGGFFSHNHRRAWVPSFFKRIDSSLLVSHLGEAIQGDVGREFRRLLQLRSSASPHVSDQISSPIPRPPF